MTRRSDADDDQIEGQRRRVAGLEAEIAVHDELHGPPPAERGSGGLWGTEGPNRSGNDLHSSGPLWAPNS